MSGALEHIEAGLPASDRRTHLRQPVRALAYVELDEGNGGIVLNASEGGLSVQAVMSLMEDSLPKMRFQLSQNNNWLETSARVVWANQSRKVAGLQFVDLPEQTRLQIREWLTGEAVGVEPAEGHEPAVADEETQDSAEDQASDQVHVRDRRTSASGKRSAAADVTTAPLVEPAPAPTPVAAVPATHVFGQTSLFPANSRPLESDPPDRKRSDRAWNLAGIAALLAIVSLLAGWIAGHGSFDSLLDKLEGTASPAKTAQANLAPASAGSSRLISDIETVDVHNQRWTIPFNPVASGYLANHGQAAPVAWPAFNPAAATPEIQMPAAGDDASSRQPTPPQVTASSENAATIPLPSQAPDPRDLAPPAPKAEPNAAQPVATLEHGALIYHVNPVYPELAREQNVQGTVRLHVTIGVSGAVRSVIAVSGPGLLIEAARSAVRQWRYTPSLLDGKPVESQEDISIVFQLPPTSK
jgi:TonB family protein